MRPIHEMLRIRKRELADQGHRLTYSQIAAQLQLLGIKVDGGAVGHWFTGRNKPGVEELIALAKVMDTSIARLAGEDPQYVITGEQKLAMEILARMSPEQRQAFLIMGKTIVNL
jgi:transcriptional regulator with XRE-family HTH domain